MRVIPVNCQGVMGAGLALEAKIRHPELLKILKKMEIKPGETLIVPRTSFVFMATKDKWRKPTEVEWVQRGLKALRNLLDKHPYPCNLPAVGCGLGGLSWMEDVQPLVEKFFSDYQGELYVYAQPPEHAKVGIFVWLDDERNPSDLLWWDKIPEGIRETSQVLWVTDVHSAIEAIVAHHDVLTGLSLDNDLGEHTGQGTQGYEVADWLEKFIIMDASRTRSFYLGAHTSNPPARSRMEAAFNNVRRVWAQRGAS